MFILCSLFRIPKLQFMLCIYLSISLLSTYMSPVMCFKHVCKTNFVCSRVKFYSGYLRSARFPVEIPLSELLNGVESKEVTTVRPPFLKNKYYGLRHGESEANLQGIISSNPAIGCHVHGLTVSGRIQARRSATAILEKIGRDNVERIEFLSSDFTRAHQTATECIEAIKNIFEFELKEIKSEFFKQTKDISVNGLDSGSKIGTADVFERLQSMKVHIREDLRERFFGSLDGTVLINYNKVWPVDLIDAENTRYGVESVTSVIGRISRLVSHCEREYEGRFIILTSHADTLQIAQTFLSSEDPRKFSQYRFKNGEVRNMEELPAPVPLTYK